jgi:hypothetical protein
MLARSMVLGLTWSALTLLPMRAPDLPAQYLPVYGGSGGTAFTRTCGAGKVLTGVRYRKGATLDAIGLLCRPVLADGSLGSESTVGTLVGGGGGTSGSESCGAGRVLVGGTILYGTYVDALKIECRLWDKATRTYGSADAGHLYLVTTASAFSLSNEKRSYCEQNSQPLAGFRGREASLVDAIGFICNEP